MITERESIRNETVKRRWFLRFLLGCEAIWRQPERGLTLVLHIAICVAISHFRNAIFHIENALIFAEAVSSIVGMLILVWLFGGLFFAVVLCGLPRGGEAVRRDLCRAGVVNHAGEAPLLVSRTKGKKNPRITVLEFEALGIGRSGWEDKRAEIETALNVNIVKITDGKNKRRVLLHTVPANTPLPDSILWKDEYLSPENFTLKLGEDCIGPVSIDLAKMPHVMLGGSSGSGKSLLLKLMLYQCARKGAEVYVIDFKGGADYPAVWREKTRMVFDEQGLLSLLTDVVDELNRRKELFGDGCPNIDVFNMIAEATQKEGLPRLVIGFDEIAEAIDRTGLGREQKEIVAQIESKLATIARLGRAYGLHLILATQRPSADLIQGQIRTNILFRCCGRADQILSGIILDRTDAADMIPKDAQGRFLLHDGTLFQAYFFDDSTWRASK